MLYDIKGHQSIDNAKKDAKSFYNFHKGDRHYYLDLGLSANCAAYRG